MRSLKTVWLVALVLGVFMAQPVHAKDKPSKMSDCDKIKSADRRNLCLAISNPTHGKEGVNRFENKDHSWYYCSLIRSRDLQNLCQAVIDSKKSKCELIGNREIEAECKSHF